MILLHNDVVFQSEFHDQHNRILLKDCKTLQLRLANPPRLQNNDTTSGKLYKSATCPEPNAITAARPQIALARPLLPELVRGPSYVLARPGKSSLCSERIRFKSRSEKKSRMGSGLGSTAKTIYKGHKAVSTAATTSARHCQTMLILVDTPASTTVEKAEIKIFSGAPAFKICNTFSAPGQRAARACWRMGGIRFELKRAHSALVTRAPPAPPAPPAPAFRAAPARGIPLIAVCNSSEIAFIRRSHATPHSTPAQR
ncbi:hypothetical protein EVAR_477_1 [Eumeta japonica]|uniref:Uncharacterized protein n=1 Tax=Eumeta variegata TaxID=151549 RepID=A0A4C1SDI9_EUMVA|nr:hypothetical protein EVAR_477_1 [Eumeta japonica]